MITATRATALAAGLAIAAAILALAVAAPSRVAQVTSPAPPGVSPFPATVGGESAWEALAGNPSFSTFTTLTASKADNIVQLLNAKGASVTVFVPTNEAFQPLLNLPIFGPLNSTSVLNGVLQQVLGYHVHNGSVITSVNVPTDHALSETTLVPSANVTLQRSATRPVSAQQLPGIITLPLWVNDANATYPDTLVANGVIHGIDRLLSPAFLVPRRGMPTSVPPVAVPSTALPPVTIPATAVPAITLPATAIPVTLPMGPPTAPIAIPTALPSPT
ncbi:hypothetical protein GGF31_000013 [Allomyces arbusculus]|nr:hypothetical protein GGF31_000013 [Allomyces arbusculus]